MEEHIKALGLRSERAYQAWCLSNGFAASLKKSTYKLEQEQAYYNDKKHHDLLRHFNTKKLSFPKTIESIRTTKKLGFYSNLYSQIEKNYKFLCKRGLGDLFLSVLLYLDTVRSKIHKEPSTVESISYLVLHNKKWVRPFSDWKPKTKNVYRQLASFARHLMAKYKVPTFMDCAWDHTAPESLHIKNARETYQNWFYHIGIGGNIRTAENLPCALSKKEAHHFLQAPKDYSITEAFRWGQIKALGGDLRLIHAMRETKLMTAFNYNDFCLQVIRFFVDNPMLDTVHISPIIDYIWHQKYEQQRVFVGRGRMEVHDPPQPNFSMTGRTAESLLKHVERWHRQLGKEAKNKKNLEWEHHPVIKDYHWIQGKAEKGNLREWRIIHLISHRELADEGRALKHCVASYAGSCANGSQSIWSLMLNSRKQITIGMRKSQIDQMRGRYNRRPDEKELNVIRRWAQKENVSIAGYLV